MATFPTSRQPAALAALVLLAASLGACRSDRIATTGSIHTSDERTRHPFVLTDGTRTLDVFPTGPGHLDPRQASDIDAFLLEYRRYGRGTIALDIPRGASPSAGAAIERTAAAIRSQVARAGVPAGALSAAGYAVTDPSLASPVRLSFQRMEAKVAIACGLWPNDLGASDYAFSHRNQPSWNQGCATRSNIAAQVADPVDLVRGREEGRIDTIRRTQVINQLREGKDPSTEWRQDGKATVKDAVKN